MKGRLSECLSDDFPCLCVAFAVKRMIEYLHLLTPAAVLVFLKLKPNLFQHFWRSHCHQLTVILNTSENVETRSFFKTYLGFFYCEIAGLN